MTTVVAKGMVTVTQKEQVSVTETVTVPAKLGELEFPKAGYRGTVVVQVATAIETKTLGDGKGKSMEGPGTPIYGSDGSIVGYLPIEG
jgi:hypothetical protein